jgi:hypothetical protein
MITLIILSTSKGSFKEKAQMILVSLLLDSIYIVPSLV